MIPELRDYQKQIIENVRSEMRQGNKTILITSPTGSGKTLLTAHMLKTAQQKGVTSWFIVHRRELIKQSIRAFNEVEVSHGVIATGYLPARKIPIQIASIQTLIKRYHQYPQPKLLFFDECHHVAAGSWDKIYKAFPDAYKIGLTATPARLDGTGLGHWFDRLVHGPSVEWLIDNKFLSPYRLYAPASIDLSGVHSSMGDYVKSELAAVIDKPSITGDAIKHYKKYAEGKRAVVFCASVAHSMHVVNQFNQSGITAVHVDGTTPTDERDTAIRRFQNGEVRVLSNVELFGEGFDVPAIESVILLRPTQSLGLYLQQIGRALRPCAGKDCAIILDHAGNCARHGLPDEKRVWNLAASRSHRAASTDADSVGVKICPRCFAAQYSGKNTCLYCGYSFPVKSREIEEKKGELVEVDKEKLKKEIRKAQGRIDTLEGLIEEGKRRGYPRAELWAKYVFNSRQAKKLQGVA
jgi:superfamily II DNA or RNA helicase